MVILVLFNEFRSCTVKTMQDQTGIEVNLFLQILCGLLNSKLLLCREINHEEIKENDIKMEYNIHIAEDFKR